MRTKTGPNGSADKHVKEIKRKTRLEMEFGIGHDTRLSRLSYKIRLDLPLLEGCIKAI